MKTAHKITLLIIFLAILAVASTCEPADISKAHLMFGLRCELFLVERGWFSNSDYPLKFFNSRWNWKTEDGKWHQLYIPHIIDSSEKYYTVLDYGGRIRVTKKKDSSRYEIKCLDGGWYENPGGEWVELE